MKQKNFCTQNIGFSRPSHDECDICELHIFHLKETCNQEDEDCDKCIAFYDHISEACIR